SSANASYVSAPGACRSSHSCLESRNPSGPTATKLSVNLLTIVAVSLLSSAAAHSVRTAMIWSSVRPIVDSRVLDRRSSGARGVRGGTGGTRGHRRFGGHDHARIPLPVHLASWPVLGPAPPTIHAGAA